MKVNIWNTIQQLSKERGLETETIVNAIRESLEIASLKYFKNNEDITINFNPEKGELRVYTIKKVRKDPKNPASEISLYEANKINSTAAINDDIEIDLPSTTLGRITAQAAKKVILKKVKDAEQKKVYNSFLSRKGELITGVVRRFDPAQNIIFESNKTDILLPKREKLPEESFRRGDRIKASIIQVIKDTNGPQVIASRSDKRFLIKLLETEIPEIFNGNIIIQDIVRLPGERSKVAVSSQENDIDPIGACIGVRGNRILSISKELLGEKIDIITWSDNPLTYAKSALSPAKVNTVSIINEKGKILQAIVSKDQFSLAIGKKGANVRLASQLIGWKIEIKSR